VIVILYDVEQKEGYYIYTENDFYNIREIKWFIPKELHNNEIVKSQMSIKSFEELIRNIDSIKAYNIQLSNLYLDIERKSVEKRKQIYKEKCHQIIENINKGLSPYHWEIQKYTSSKRRDCYLIGLFAGENRFEKEIESL